VKGRPFGGPSDYYALVDRLHARLLSWLLVSAYPLWATKGYDTERGGFHERLGEQGPVAADPRRARVQARQVYCFANAATLGWNCDPMLLVTEGLDYFLRYFRRPDGLFRTLCAADGRPLDDRAFLYDQAFALLALAESQRSIGRQAWLREEAHALMAAMNRSMRRKGGGFGSGDPERLPLLSNPHMHLLEAALAWRTMSSDPLWDDLADEIVALALDRFIDSQNGVLRESFAEDWSPLDGLAGRLVEPGHLYEWAWLLLRWGNLRDSVIVARRLVAIADRYGVRDGVVINSLLDDLTAYNAHARLWPQTERLKVSARLAVADESYWAAAAEAAQTVIRYLEAAGNGLWRDCMTPQKRFTEEPAPASNFYHIVCCIDELGRALNDGRRASS
jgi:mannose/cellobiose epimerase-like protein (N-acyl-D-glucosamine 2-epimerase family)